MRDLRDITDFQKECIKKTKDLIQRITGKQINFKKVKGRNETFYKSQIFNMDVYIYVDEAGFMTNNKDWRICEKPDYSSQEELIKDFLSQLRDFIEHK